MHHAADGVADSQVQTQACTHVYLSSCKPRAGSMQSTIRPYDTSGTTPAKTGLRKKRAEEAAERADLTRLSWISSTLKGPSASGFCLLRC